MGCTRCVRACKDLRGVEALGYSLKNGSVHVGTLHGPTLKDSGCRFCGACVEVCPTGALMDLKPFSPSEKEDILVPCRASCPAAIDVPAYVRAISEGDPDRALSIVCQSVPLPAILGMVCHHPCEDACRRGDINEPLAICDLKRFCSENGKSPGALSPLPRTGKRVAVIGSGPAGLTAAHYLRVKGHHVTVFEGEERPGGMLRYGIPRYRLPDNILEGEISTLLEGVELKTGVSLGQDFHLSDLSDQGFDSIFLATGMGRSKRLDLPGEDCEGLYWGVDFLKEVNKGRKPALGEKVVVMGGGNVALDVALCCLRLGASDVKVVCLESEGEMPAFEKEIEAAREEGAAIMNSWGPKEIDSLEKKVKGITLKRCTRVLDEQGEFSPQYDESETEYLPADNVILAIGQEPDMSVVSLPHMPECEPSGQFSVKGTKTSIPTVFAGGDAARGASSVIEAVADGKKAADQIDRLLGGEGFPAAPESGAADPNLGRDERFYDRSRTPMPRVAPKERKKTFAPVELGYSQKEARHEASRCLQCDLRLQIQATVLPPEKWVHLDQKALDQVPEKEGIYQLADGKKMTIKIKGTQNLLRSIAAELSNENAQYFCFEEDPMYTKRESELIQRHLQRYGELPGSGEEDLDELF
ncbi:MAG: FAD-dependent oxidoreductase [bacterium]